MQNEILKGKTWEISLDEKPLFFGIGQSLMSRLSYSLWG